MAVRSIVPIGDPLLRQPADALSREELAEPVTQLLIDDMIDTMRDAAGAGLAAPQIGVSKRIAVVEVTTNRRYPYKPPIPLTVIVNPTLRALGDETVVINEGCLSVPLRGELERHVSVEVAYLDRRGESTLRVYRGLTAGTFQHEIDHLLGVLIVDRVDTRTLSTWEQYERFSKDGFERRIAQFVDRVGS